MYQWIAVSKRCGFGEWIHWFREDGRPIRIKIMRFQNYLDSLKMFYFSSAWASTTELKHCSTSESANFAARVAMRGRKFDYNDITPTF